MTAESDTHTEAGNSGTTSTDTSAASQGKPTITEAQLRERLGREKKKFERDLEKAREQSGQAALEAFKEEHGIDDQLLSALKDKRDQEKVVFQKSDVDKLHAQIKKLSGEREKAVAAAEKISAAWTTERKGSALVAAAAAAGAIRPDQVAKLLDDRVRLDAPDGELYVVGDDGDASEQSLDEMVKAFLNDNLHLLQPRSRGPGAGSRAGGGLRNGTPEEGSREWQEAKLRELFGG